ncbi:hypothetical protein [Rubrobacter xylanophilus]|uniref:hypothetical protein n=1 Tax=Rubrobacter xylanophilus TaxID=49319 RepID=UPI001C641EE9|nr:hypothetical protein [Rubrobacter xylanophilus]
MEELRSTPAHDGELGVAWEGLAASCASPLRRLGGFLLVGFALFAATTTAVILYYNLFGERSFAGQGVAVPHTAFYATMGLSAAVAGGGYLLWLYRSLRSYAAFSRILRGRGLDPRRPTRDGLSAYSDEQLLALRTRYERALPGPMKERLARIFGFHEDDSFSLGPLSARPGTFEMGMLRVEWEANLLLRSGEPLPEISWWTESRYRLLPRKPSELCRLLFALRYTTESVRELKRRYGYSVERWHKTVPEGELWDAIRDHEEARRIQAALHSRRISG